MTSTPDPRAGFARYRALMDSHGFRPSKRLGQNFLLEPALHRAIADAVAVGPSDFVLEVGPGLGFLTRELAARARRVIAVEIDPRLVAILRRELGTFTDAERVQLVHADILGTGGMLADEVAAAIATELSADDRFLVVANLPYAVTGPCLAALVQAQPRAPEAMALLVQLELGERIAAAPGTGEYGSLSALLQAGYEVALVRRVGREVFRPRPNVDSAIVRLRARPAADFLRGPAAERQGFARFVRAVFGMRRKTLRHGLERARAELGHTWSAPAEVLSRRAEQLTADELLALFRRADVPPRDDSPAGA